MKHLKIDPTEPFNDNFNELGLGTRYMLNNLGTLLIFFLVYPTLVIFYRFIFLFRNCCLCCKRIQLKLKRDLFYGMILTGIIESYATLALCCLVSFYTLRWDSYGQIIQSASCFIFAAIVVYMPIFIYRIFTNNFESLSGEKTT